MTAESSHRPQAAIDALQAELRRLAEAEDDARLDVQVAQSKATAIAREKRNIAKAIRLLTDSRSETLNKQSLQTLVERALAKGPLPEKDLRDRLEAHLKEKQKSTSGLGLLLSKIREGYVADDGRWSLPDAKPSATG